MKKLLFLYISLLITSLLMASCATSRNTDGAVDACKLTKPPKEAHVENAGHVGRSFTYPDITTIPNNYSGCIKVWLGDYGLPPTNYFLLYSMQFKKGHASRVEGYEPSDDDETVKLVLVCEFDENHLLIKGSRGDCTDYENFSVIESKKKISHN